MQPSVGRWRWPSGRTITGLFGQIRVPPLVCVGLNDHVYPIEIARTMHQKISHSTLEIMPDAAHAAIFEGFCAGRAR